MKKGLPKPAKPECLATLPAGEVHPSEGTVRIAYSTITGERLDFPKFIHVCADCAHDFYPLAEFQPYL